MIQRVQTVFLFLSAVATGLLFFFPLVDIGNSVNGGTLFIGSIKLNESGDTLMSAWPLTFLAIVVLWLSLFSIFLYKRRVLQMRLTIYNMILMAGLIGIGYFYAVLGKNQLDGDIGLRFFSIMPVISIILSFLAWRGIRRDHLMLKAIDRIR